MDWVRFLSENNIHYVTRGPNTKRGEVSIQCPMCGDDDPSEHLGINLETGNWGCHRDATHRGKSARWLIKAILGCSSRQAQFILNQYSHADPDTLEAALAVLEGEDKPQEVKKAYINPDTEFAGFRPIKPRGVTKRFFSYLQRRGYDNPQTLITSYGLRCALTGKYQDRVILPIRMNKQLIGWTSRAIVDPRSAPRYLASSENVKTVIFNFDGIKKGGDRLIIVEGPFDALKIDNFMATNGIHDVHATCVFGTSVTISQIAILRVVVKKFNSTWVLFDQGADGPANELASWLDVKVAYLPEGCKDPDQLTDDDLDQLATVKFAGHFARIPAQWRKMFGSRKPRNFQPW